LNCTQTKKRAKPVKNRAKLKNRAKIEKTEQNQKKPSQTGKNRTEPKPVGLKTGFSFFLNFTLIIFLIKIKSSQK
jgi:hypothetical protein